MPMEVGKRDAATLLPIANKEVHKVTICGGGYKFAP